MFLDFKTETEVLAYRNDKFVKIHLVKGFKRISNVGKSVFSLNKFCRTRASVAN